MEHNCNTFSRCECRGFCVFKTFLFSALIEVLIFRELINTITGSIKPILKIIVFQNLAPCNMAETDRPPTNALMLVAASTSETSVNFYQTKRCNIPEENHLHARCREILKSYLVNVSNHNDVSPLTAVKTAEHLASHFPSSVSLQWWSRCQPSTIQATNDCSS
jgi:hypothetical protein